MTDHVQEKLKKQLEQLRRTPENKRCANCASMAVPYVCLDFGTFVCTRCSALHRDFTHKVKSLTASKFKPEECWSEDRFKLPGGGNEESDRAREFIKLKYVTKAFMTPQQQAAPPQQQYQQQVEQYPQQGYQQTQQDQPQQHVQQAHPPQNTFQAPQAGFKPQFGGQPNRPAPQVAATQPDVQQAPPPPPPPAQVDLFADMFGGAPAPAPVQQAPAQQFQQSAQQQQQFVQQPPVQQFQQPVQQQQYQQPVQQQQQYQQQPPQQYQQQQQYPQQQQQFQQQPPQYQNQGFQQAAPATVFGGAPKFNAAAFVSQPTAPAPAQGGFSGAPAQGAPAQQKQWSMFDDMAKASAAVPGKPAPAAPAQPKAPVKPAPQSVPTNLLDF